MLLLFYHSFKHPLSSSLPWT